MFDLVVNNGIIVTSDNVYEGDICIKDGKITAIMESGSDAIGKHEIDAKGRYVLPGAIDSHAHLNDPGFTWREDYEHGTAAAAVGGVTTIVDMPMQNEPALTSRETLLKKEEAVSKNAYVDYCYWGGFVDYNFDNLKELDEEGVVAYKSFIGPVSPDYVSLSMGQVREGLEILKTFDARAGFHCEDYSIIKWEEARAKREGRKDWRAFLDSRPLSAELIATKGIIDLAKETGAKVHICHVSHPDVAEEIRVARLQGVDITGETCGHYLTYTEEDVLNKGSIFKCAPPLRDSESREKLWDYVNDGTLCCVGSDHSPCEESEKCEEKHGVFGAWGGISGIQNVMQVMYSEGVNKRGYEPQMLARVLSEGPAKTFGIYGRKGSIDVGFDADIVILDPEKEWEITADSLMYLNKISAFVGLRGKGLPVCTIVRGDVVAMDGEVVGEKGFGELVKKIK
ncbi:allantoinase [Peptoclostridium litorale DSM 5388]|uniref:allantoinase n=1 Tax=Peptoclostridium litorale DSM 5388 TaxID=1121324 RepID=A0A069RJH7_PEPLI|nr:allantoinase AllB [Peptoclostridium litorale]KDR96305.1 allantoinase AllB [Peptoclostridium litorale DSM 5388]SIO26063.1 allantoinase [Peptoclostridium litorale DSM 5388]